MLRVALIGLGMAVEPHALSLLELRDRIEVRWAASPTPARTEAFAARYPFPVTNDVPAAIADPSVDAIILLTPPNTHLELATLAAAKGKHLLIEKPLDVSLERSEAIIAAAEAAELRLGVVLQHRFRPGAVRLGELLEQHALGRVQAASLSAAWWRPQSYYDEPGRGDLARDGGGVLMTQAIHSLDLFRALLGPLQVHAAQARTTALHRMQTEDFVSALLWLPDGASGSVMATTAAYPGRAERIEIIGAAGSAALVGGALDVQWLDGRRESVAASGATGAGSKIMDFPHTEHRALIADFCSAIEDGHPPRVCGREALATQRLIKQILDHGKEARAS